MTESQSIGEPVNVPRWMWEAVKWVAGAGLLGAFSTISVVAGFAINHEGRISELEKDQQNTAALLVEIRADQKQMRAEQQSFYREFDRTMAAVKEAK